LGRYISSPAIDILWRFIPIGIFLHIFALLNNDAMSKAAQTRQFIIEKTAVLFNTKGYEGTTLSDITTATGLTKGSIYGNFGNKNEVALAVYKFNAETYGNNLDIVLEEKNLPREKLAALTGFFRNNWKAIFSNGGCPLLNAAVEADDNLSFLKKSVQSSFKSLANTISDILEQGKKQAVFKKGIDTEEYAYTIIMLLEGGVLLSKITNNSRHLFTALDRIDMIIKTEIIK